MTPTGAEQGNVTTLNNNSLQNCPDSGGAESGAFNAKNAKNQAENMPEDLAGIVQIWPELPDNIKTSILAMIKAVR